MENFVSLILKESIDIYHCNRKYDSNEMEYWNIELYVFSDDNDLMIERYAEKIIEIFNKCNELDLHYVIRHFCMTNFCEFLSEKIKEINLDLKLKKVIISPKKDKFYKFIWESQC